MAYKRTSSAKRSKSTSKGGSALKVMKQGVGRRSRTRTEARMVSAPRSHTSSQSRAPKGTAWNFTKPTHGL